MKDFNRFFAFALTCTLIVVLATLLYVRSLSVRHTLLVLDAGVSTDIGYVQLIVPLGKLTHDGTPESIWLSERLEKGSWMHPELNMSFPTLAQCLAKPFEQTGCWSKQLFGIGFWHGPERSMVRRTPFIVVFVPIPILAGMLLVCSYIAYRLNFTLGLKTLLAMPFVFAVSISCFTYLLTMRCS